MVNTGKRSELLTLFGDFLKLGLFTYGGGWSLIAQMQQKYVDERKIITSEELLDLVSVGKSIPGVMITNVAMLFGYRTLGLAGGIVCVLGMCLPPLAVLILISFFYGAFRENYWINAAMMGMQAGVVPIIANAAKNLVKGSLTYPPCILIIFVSTAFYLFTDLNPVILVLIGAVCGLLISNFYEKRRSETNGIA